MNARENRKEGRTDGRTDGQIDPKTETHNTNELGRRTEGVETLLGDPKSAILKLSAPMIASMMLLSLYNVVDAFWVAGLGSDALAATGFVFPFYFIALGIATGLGVGGGSAISRRIGAQDKTGADSVAQHTMLIMAFVAITFTVPLYLASDSIFILLGAGSAAQLAAEYGKVIFAGTVFVLFSNTAYAILRGEGDAKRAMYAMGFASVFNIVLDPLFIYTLDWGISGAALATVLSIAFSSAVMLYWMAIKRDTYVSLHVRGFFYEASVVREILHVGMPASFEFVAMALVGVVINLVLVIVSSTDGVAVSSVGMRVIEIAMMPLIAMSTAVITVSGAAFGAKAFQKIDVAHIYSVKVGLLIALALSGVTYLFAPEIAAVFTYSEGSSHLAPEIVTFLHIMCLFYPAVPLGMFAIAVFQGAGEGMPALAISMLRTIVFNLFFVVLFSIGFNWGLPGVWWGMVAGNLLGDSVGHLWVRMYVGNLLKEAA